MKAAVCHAFGEPLRVEEVELRRPGLGEVSVRLAACAVCHSDIAFMQGAWAQFARTGDPGWKSFDTATRATMMLDRECQLADDPGRAERVAQRSIPLP